MRKQSVYLETTIFNFIFTEDALEKMQATLRFMQEIREGKKFVPYTSVAVIDELIKEQTDKREKMLAVIPDYGIEVLGTIPDVMRLADLYVHEGIIPLKYRDDAVHIAFASVADIAIVLSWNFRHIVKLKTRSMVNAINMREGYRTIEICSPQEVIEYEEFE